MTENNQMALTIILKGDDFSAAWVTFYQSSPVRADRFVEIMRAFCDALDVATDSA